MSNPGHPHRGAARTQEEVFRKREEALKKRDLELQESLIRFSKFLQVCPVLQQGLCMCAVPQPHERVGSGGIACSGSSAVRAIYASGRLPAPPSGGLYTRDHAAAQGQIAATAMMTSTSPHASLAVTLFKLNHIPAGK